jgi:hypothetical protein
MEQIPSRLLETAPNGTRHSEYMSECRTLGDLHAFVSKEFGAGGKPVCAYYDLRNVNDIQSCLTGVMYEYVFLASAQQLAAKSEFFVK